MDSKKGSFILFEGIDRCGKTTQSKMLVEHFKAQDIKVEYIQFPDRSTEIGKVIDRYLKGEIELNDQAIHLLFSANRWEYKDKITKLLADGVNIVMDRYIYSGICYSVAKGLDWLWCHRCDEGLPEPDIVFYMNLPISEQAKRLDIDRERYEYLEFQQKVYDNYSKLYVSDKVRWITIDATLNKDTIHNIIVQYMLRYEKS